MLGRNELVDNGLSLFDHDDIGIEVNRVDGCLNSVRRYNKPAMRVVHVFNGSIHSVQTIHQPRDIGCKSILPTVNVLTEINSAWTHKGKDFLECYTLLFRCVPPVIYHNVRRRKYAICQDPSPERPIGLISDKDISARLFISTTGRLNVHSVDCYRWAKVIAPHIK